MNEELEKISNINLVSVRNNLAYSFRFGGNCSALKFNPSNISNEESKKYSTFIINLLNEELWNFGLDIVSTNYNNGGTGFMIITTLDNKDNIRKILEKLELSKNNKKEYSVSLKNILNIFNSKHSLNNDELKINYILSIYDNYKLNSQNTMSVKLNEEANTSVEVEISERSLSSQFKKYGLHSDDQGWFTILSEFGKKFSNKTKKLVVPALLVIALFYTCQFLWKKYNDIKDKIEKDTPTNNNNKSKEKDNNHSDTNSSTNDFSPFEPAQPYEPCDLSINIGQRCNNNQRLKSLLKTLEDSDVKKPSKNNNIENKILSLLSETTTS